MLRKLVLVLLAVFVCACFAGGYISGTLKLSGMKPETITNEQIAANIVLPDETMSDRLDSFVTPPSTEPTVGAADADTIPEEEEFEFVNEVAPQ